MSPSPVFIIENHQTACIVCIVCKHIPSCESHGPEICLLETALTAGARQLLLMSGSQDPTRLWFSWGPDCKCINQNSRSRRKTEILVMNFRKKRNKISKKGARGGGQRLFVNFPKNHKFCRIQASLRNIWTCPSSAQCTPPHLPQGEREQSLLDRSWRLTEACSSGHSHFQDLEETVCKSKIQKIPFTRKLNEDT